MLALTLALGIATSAQGRLPRGFFGVVSQAQPSSSELDRTRAIRREDPGARIVAAGVAPVEGGPLPWVYLRRLYRIKRVKRSFDVVGLHPYAPSLRALEFQVRKVRAAMIGAGDGRTPLEITECGVASGGVIPSPMVKSPAGQARFLRHAYGLLIRNRSRWRISGAAWYSWRDGLHDPHCVFCQYAGLFDRSGRSKPAWHSYRRTVAHAAATRVH
jgi:hypothetical protein